MKKRNPAPRSRRIAKARALYESFHGEPVRAIEKVEFPKNPTAAVVVGRVIEIRYETVRDGKRELYRHPFRKISRPLLVTSFDGKQLILLGGAYQVTDRGIEDA